MMASDTDGTAAGTDGRGKISRYDLLLAVIPAAFLLAAILGQFLAAPTQVALSGGAVVGTLALLDGLFINPPRSGSGAP